MRRWEEKTQNNSTFKTLLRFCASLVMFGTSILVMLFIPARFIRTVFPTFLPYTTQSQVTIGNLVLVSFGNLLL